MKIEALNLRVWKTQEFLVVRPLNQYRTDNLRLSWTSFANFEHIIWANAVHSTKIFADLASGSPTNNIRPSHALTAIFWSGDFVRFSNASASWNSSRFWWYKFKWCLSSTSMSSFVTSIFSGMSDSTDRSSSSSAIWSIDVGLFLFTLGTLAPPAMKKLTFWRIQNILFYIRRKRFTSYLTPTLAESDITEAGGPYKTFSSNTIIIGHKIIKIQPLIRKIFFKARIFFPKILISIKLKMKLRISMKNLL